MGNRDQDNFQVSAVLVVADMLGFLVFFFQFYYHDFDWVFACVYICMLGVGRICGEPIGIACFPRVVFGAAVFFDDLHGATLEGDDYARMIVAVHGEGRIGVYDRLPDFDIFVFELRITLGARLLRLHYSYGSDQDDKSYKCMA